MKTTATERHRRWREANREKWRATMRAANMRWYRANPLAARASLAATHANMRAKLAGVPGKLSRADVLPLFSQPCHYCGRLDGKTRRERIGPDHVVPMAHGGSNTLDNIVPSCVACNLSKKRAAKPIRGLHWQHSEGLVTKKHDL